MQSAKSDKASSNDGTYTWRVPADLTALLDEMVEANKPFASRPQVMRLIVAQGLAVLKEATKPR